MPMTLEEIFATVIVLLKLEHVKTRRYVSL